MSLNAMYTLLAILVLPTPQKEIPAVQNIDMVWNTLMSVIMFYKRMYMYRRMQKKVIVVKMGTDTSAVIHLSIPNWFLINFQYGIKWAYTAFSHQSSCGVISVGLCKWHSRAKISLLFNLASLISLCWCRWSLKLNLQLQKYKRKLSFQTCCAVKGTIFTPTTSF